MFTSPPVTDNSNIFTFAVCSTANYDQLYLNPNPWHFKWILCLRILSIHFGWCAEAPHIRVYILAAIILVTLRPYVEKTRHTNPFAHCLHFNAYMLNFACIQCHKLDQIRRAPLICATFAHIRNYQRAHTLRKPNASHKNHKKPRASRRQGARVLFY